MLRGLREPRTGAPSRAVRLVAVLVAAALVAVSAPVLVAGVRWVLSLV